MEKQPIQFCAYYIYCSQLFDSLPNISASLCINYLLLYKKWTLPAPYTHAQNLVVYIYYLTISVGQGCEWLNWVLCS